MRRQFQAPEVGFSSDGLVDCDPLHTCPLFGRSEHLGPDHTEAAFIMAVLQDNHLAGLERYTEAPELRAYRTDINSMGERFVRTMDIALQEEAHRQNHLRP